jgi:putative chitinase
LTIAELGRVFRARTKKQLDEFLVPINEALKAYGIDTCIKKAHFLAQVGHESAQTRLLEESGISAELEKTKYGGYKGRGLLQLTFKDSYEKYGKAINKEFLGAKRVEVATPKYGSDSAGWFWKEYKGVDFSDYAQKNDFIYLTQRINGAFNGWDDRLRLLGLAVEALLVDHCPNLLACPNTTFFSLKASESRKSKVASFAFGYWFDPGTKSKSVVGVAKSKEYSLEGYRQFVDLLGAASEREKKKDGNFGFDKVQDMIDHATKRVQALEKES